MGRTTCRHVLLDAAEAVVSESGAARLTLDAVAERAGVSKGGLLYHFPSKEALLEAMLTRQMERRDTRRDAVRAKLPPGPAADLLADVVSLLERPRDDKRPNVSLLAAVANDPKLLDMVRSHYLNRLDLYAKQGGDFERKVLSFLAAVGLDFTEMMQISPFNTQQRHAIVEKLKQLAEEASADAGDETRAGGSTQGRKNDRKPGV
jgi:AcrR family transcriptional regulator